MTLKHKDDNNVCWRFSRFGAFIANIQASADVFNIEDLPQVNFLVLVEVLLQIPVICKPFWQWSKNIVPHALSCIWVVMIWTVGIIQLTMLCLICLHFWSRLESSETFSILQWCDSSPAKGQRTLMLTLITSVLF